MFGVGKFSAPMSGKGLELDGASTVFATALLFSCSSRCVASDSWIFCTIVATLLFPFDSAAVSSCQTLMLCLPVVHRLLFFVLGQSFPVLAHLRNGPLFTGVSIGRGEPWKMRLLISGNFMLSPVAFPLAYRCHRSAAGSAAGVFFAVEGCPFSPKKADVLSGWEEECGPGGEELFARFRFRLLGVSSSFELFGIQPICSSGDRCTGAGLFVSSQSPIRSSIGNRAPGVHGNVFACGICGVLCILLLNVAESLVLAALPLPCAMSSTSGLGLFSSVSPGTNWNAFNFVFAWEVAGIGGFGGGAIGGESYVLLAVYGLLVH